MQEIYYKNEYPNLNSFAFDFQIKNYLETLTTKSKEWDYEKEWRLIYYKHTDEELKFPDDVISAIYFGVYCDDNNIDTCKNLISNRKSIPELYKAKLKIKNFGLDFERIKL